MKKILIPLLFLVFVSACRDTSKADDPLAPTGRTQRTENLLSNLFRIARQGYMFGHQDSPMYGIGWVGDNARSDVKDVCNDFPAVMGFEIGRLELGDSLNIHGTPFSRIRQRIIEQYDRGGIVTISWHPKEKPGKNLQGWTGRVADFLNSLETPYGVKTPVILRLSPAFTADQWRAVVEALREREVTNALFAFSLPLSSSSPSSHPSLSASSSSSRPPFSAPSSPSLSPSSALSSFYLDRYPGDDIIDLLGLDIYCTPGDVEAFKSQLDASLASLCQIAKEHNKPFALTETGFMDIPQQDWWTTVLAPVLDRYPISYALVWRNNNDVPKHCFAPYPGQISAEDFVAFYNLPKTLFLRDIQGVYLTPPAPEAPQQKQ